MNTVAAQEIERRTIAAVHELLKDGPVLFIKNNRPRYVVMTEEHHARLAKRTGLCEAYA